MPIEVGQQENKTGHKQRVQYKLANRNGTDSAEPAFYVNAYQDTANENAPGLTDRGRFSNLEHETGLEPATPTLAKGRRRSK